MQEADFLNDVKQKVIVAILADDEIGDRLVLKGGNLLQFAYELTSRASKDVDVSVDGEFADVDFLRDRVRQRLSSAFAENGLVLFDFKFDEVPAEISDDIAMFWGGYRCFFKLVEESKFQAANGSTEKIRKTATPLDSSGSTRFKIDFSRHEFCEDKEPFVIDGYTIHGYSPRMFVAEKLRAICQQMDDYSKVIHRKRPAARRARDFVDIQVIAEHYGIDFSAAGFHEVLKRTFDQKRVPLALLGRIKETKDFHSPDFESVKATVNPSFRLKEFQFYFDYVCERCGKLESLWNV